MRLCLGAKARQAAWGVALGIWGASTLALADQVVTPPNGASWGDSNATQSLLNMNRDPDTVRSDDPAQHQIVQKGSCTDPQGHTYRGDDEGYSYCMNQKAKKAESHASTAATVLSNTLK